MWNLSFINETDFTNHVRATIEKYGEKLDAFEIVIENEIRLKEDNENLKFNLFEIDDYKIGIASHYDVPHLIEYDIEEI